MSRTRYLVYQGLWWLGVLVSTALVAHGLNEIAWSTAFTQDAKLLLMALVLMFCLIGYVLVAYIPFRNWVIRKENGRVPTWDDYFDTVRRALIDK